MALDDFDIHDFPAPEAAAPAPAQPKRPAIPEDEDLFDFPVVEMKLESEAPKRSPRSVAPEVEVARTAPAVPAAPASKPAPAAAPSAEARPATLPVKPVASASAAAAAQPAPARQPSKPGTGNGSPTKDVAQAARLVEDIEQVLGSDAKPRKRALQLQGPSSLTLVAIAVLVLTNVFGVLFLWRTSASFQDSVQAMNQQFVESLRRQALMQEAPPETAPKAAPGSTQAAAQAPAPLESFETSALQLARDEIQAGEYAAARRRLARLLAVGDRIVDAGQRDDIEAQASFLLASTYRKQAEAAREKEKSP